MFKSSVIILSLIFAIGLISSMFLSCKENSLVPPENLPGRRDYVWTIDTLKPPEGLTSPGWVWTNGPDNIWISGGAYLNGYCVWHYDGNNWTNYDPGIYWDPRGLYGFSSNDIWMGSTDGAFWHYDGSKWSKFCQTEIPDYQPFVAQGMCGNAPDNIYSVGYADSIDGMSYKAIIMHFDGTEWKQVDIPVIQSSFSHILYNNATGNFIIRAWIFNEMEENIYSFNGTTLSLLYTAESGTKSFCSFNKDIYLSIEGQALKQQGQIFKLFKRIPSELFYWFNRW